MNARRIIFSVVFLFSLATLSPAAELRILHGHIPEVVARLNLQPTGRLSATNRLHLTIGLPWRDQAALTNLLSQLYDPVSTNFHHYLTPDQFTAKFGPAESDYQNVVEFAMTNGLTIVRTNAGRGIVDVSANVSDIERSFHIILYRYRHPTESREFYAPDAEPSVDATHPILSIAGLNNYTLPHPMAARHAAAQSMTEPNGSGPGGSYQGHDFRNAYAPSVTLNGAGQSVGLVEFDGYYASDIAAYESQAGLPNVSITNVLLDYSFGVPSNNTNSVAEVSLDIEMVISMAPGLAKLYVFEADDFLETTTDDMLGLMVTNNQIKQFSSSWGMVYDAKADELFQQMAVQGQSFFQASGDGDAYNQPITWPSDDPYVTSVGGTTLRMDTTGTNYLSETVWNWGFQPTAWPYNGGVPGGGYIGSGGGVSTVYSIPSWQQGANPVAADGSATMRNLPDVALTADNVYLIYFNGLTNSGQGGTSCAAPLWAGFLALVNQQATAEGKPAVGFLNPALYAIGELHGYRSPFHIVTGTNTWPGSPNRYYATTGYNLCTGWGTPSGTNMINALAGFAGPVFLDLNYTGGTNNGSFDYPFKSLGQAINGVGTGGTIVIKTAGSSSQTINISKPINITAIGGTATIGQ